MLEARTHHSTEFFFLPLFLITPDGLELALVLIGQRNIHSLLHGTLHLLLFFLQDTFLCLLYHKLCAKEVRRVGARRCDESE